eukprot:1840623-Lingulodinium_polyedra.AAC.1
MRASAPASTKAQYGVCVLRAQHGARALCACALVICFIRTPRGQRRVNIVSHAICHVRARP